MTTLTTLVIGLDGACKRVLEPMVDDGSLPALASLSDSGVNGTLESQVPPWTASAWPSLYTGTNPGKHGVFGFLSFEGYKWEVVNATHVRQPAIWELLSERGGTSVVVNVPVTHPPRPFAGALIPGYTAPENPTCHPDEVLDDVREAIGEYRIYPQTEGRDGVAPEARLGEYETLARMRGGAFRYLSDQYDPDLGFLQFQVTDTVCHELPGDEDALRRVYGAVDEQIAATLDATDPDTVVVVSDHGIGPVEDHVRVNEVLREANYLESMRGGSGMPTWSAVRDDHLQHGDDRSTPSRGMVESLMTAAASAGITTQRVGALLERVGLSDVVLQFVPSNAVRAASEQVDFESSAAYMRSRVECGLRINLQGREPDGQVAPAEYEQVRDELIELFVCLTTPDGDRVFEDVARREKYFHGPEADRAVDIILVPTNYEHYMTTWLLGEPFADADGPEWDHKRDGIVVVNGDGISTDCDLSSAHLFDVAPTVLATLGVPAAAQMDGETLPAVEATGRAEYSAVECDRDLLDSEDVESRLENLGYLER